MVDYTQQMQVFINNQNGMYLVLVHDVLYFRYLGVGQYHLGMSCHDVTHRLVEELGLPFFHRTTYVSVCNQSYDLAVLQ